MNEIYILSYEQMPIAYTKTKDMALKLAQEYSIFINEPLDFDARLHLERHDCSYDKKYMIEEIRLNELID
jgi:hypothetical protein